MIALAALGCRSTPARPAIPAPPVDWGELSVHATGRVALDADVPVLCGDDQGLVFRAHSATDAPWWALSLERPRAGADLGPIPMLSLMSGADRQSTLDRWASIAVDPGTDSGGSWSGVVLAAAGPSGTVRVDVKVRCGGPARVPDAVIPILREVAGAEVRPYATIDLGRVQVPGPISALVPRERGFDMVQALRERLPNGFVAYQGTSRFADGHEPRVEVVVAAGKGPEDVIRTANVDPVDASLDTVDVAHRVQTWVDRFRADLVQADAESVTALIPDSVDSTELAREAAAFCPAVIEQAGSVPAYALEIDHNHQLWCWWE